MNSEVVRASSPRASPKLGASPMKVAWALPTSATPTMPSGVSRNSRRRPRRSPEEFSDRIGALALVSVTGTSAKDTVIEAMTKSSNPSGGASQTSSGPVA